MFEGVFLRYYLGLYDGTVQYSFSDIFVSTLLTQRDAEYTETLSTRDMFLVTHTTHTQTAHQAGTSMQTATNKLYSFQ
jgi:hypothetical protein